MLNETESAVSRETERDSILARVTSRMAQAIIKGEDAALDTIIGAGYGMAVHTYLSLWAKDTLPKGTGGRKAADVALDVYAALALQGRGVVKGEPVPANITNITDARNYVVAARAAGTLRTQPKQLVARATALARRVYVKHRAELVKTLHAADEVAGEAAFTSWAKAQFGTLAEFEIWVTGEKKASGKPRERTKLDKLLERVFDRAADSQEIVPDAEILEAIEFLAARTSREGLDLVVMALNDLVTEPEAEAEAIAA